MARPRPNSLSCRSSPSGEGGEHAEHDQRRGGDHTSGRSQAVGDGDGVVLRAVVLLLDPRQQEDLVVHRQTEDDGEQEHRHPRLDRPGLVDADQAHAPAPLEDGDEDAVGGADRQQVHDHGLQRHENTSEHSHQQDEAEQQHDADEHRHAVADEPGEVGRPGRGPTDLGVDPGRGDHVVTEVVDERRRLLVLRRRTGLDTDHLQRAGLERLGWRGDHAGDVVRALQLLDEAAEELGILGGVALDDDDQRAVRAGTEALGQAGRTPGARSGPPAGCRSR